MPKYTCKHCGAELMGDAPYCSSECHINDLYGNLTDARFKIIALEVAGDELAKRGAALDRGRSARVIGEWRKALAAWEAIDAS